MDTEEIKQTTETKHLGIKRNNKNNIDIEDRIKLARRTIYALLGPGLHARRGMSPVVAYKLWKRYVITRALYGIEVMNHTASDIIQLEKLQRKICRQIQGLPDRVANVATYSLLGVEPIEAVIDKLILIFFGSILQNKDTIEYRIIERQISMDKPNGKSFASLVYDKLRKYKLPDLMDLMENPIEKHKWKKLVKQHIEIYWEEAWIEEKQTKSTLKFLNLQHPLFGNSHQVWKTVPKNSMEVKKAEVKARLLTGTYMLKETKAKFSRNTDTPLCELCYEETEDVKHFLLICPTLNDIREEHLYTLKCYLNNIQEGAYEAICENKQLIQLILDSSMDILKGIVTLTKRNHIDIEQITRTLCYCLHVKRTRLSAK